MTPYLTAAPEKVERWSRVIDGPGLRVGFAWAGSKAPGYGRQARNSDPAQFAPLVATPGTSWYCLQRDEEPCDLPVTCIGGLFTSLADTAGAIANLDLLIAPDCVLAHLAGAMGVPCLMFLPVSSDWRWLTGREDTPWYDSVTIVRQTVAGDWLSVMERVRGKLLEEAANREQKETAGVAQVRRIRGDGKRVV